MAAPGGNAVLRNEIRDDGNINKIDGVPIHPGYKQMFFNQTWKILFLNALGTKTQDGYTLRSVAEGKDQGGTVGFWLFRKWLARIILMCQIQTSPDNTT